MKEYENSHLSSGDLCTAAYGADDAVYFLYLYDIDNPHRRLYPPFKERDVMLVLGRIEDETFIDYIVFHPTIGPGRLNIYWVKKLW